MLRRSAMVSKGEPGKGAAVPGCLSYHEEPFQNRYVKFNSIQSTFLRGIGEYIRVIQTCSKEKHGSSGDGTLTTRQLGLGISSVCPKTVGLPWGDICECHLCLLHCQAEARAAQASMHGNAKDLSRRG